MINAKRQALLVFLAFVGMLASLTDAHAFGRRCRCWQSQCQEQCVTNHYIVSEVVLANPTVSGNLHDHTGASLNGTKVFIEFKNKNGDRINTTTIQESSNGSYNYTIPGTPNNIVDDIMRVTFQKENGTLIVEYKVSYKQLNHVIHAIVPE